MAMLPREHGAYGQMIFPLTTALAISAGSATSVLIAVAVLSGFLAHEPASVLMGRRGLRARRESGRAAAAWLAATGSIAIGAGVAAMVTAAPDTRWSFVVPMVPAAIVMAAWQRGAEKTTLGETAVAVTFSCAAIPLCVTAGAPLASAMSVAGAFASVFVSGTLGVRVVILRVRGGGDARAVAAARSWLLLVAGIGAIGMAAGAWLGVLEWAPLLASAPGLILALALAIKPPSPVHLRTVGWLLVSTSVFALLVLVASLR